MFDLGKDFYDETKIEEIELNCSLTINVPLRAIHDFIITKLRWSFQHHIWITDNIHPIDDLAHPIILDIRRKTLALAKLSVSLTVYKMYPEPHLTQHDIHVLREILNTAKFHMGTHTGYYVQKLKKIEQKQSRWKSSFLVVPVLNVYSWWCQHWFLLTSENVSHFFSTASPSDVY